MLPAVRPSCGVLGETAAIEGLAAGIPVAGLAGDQQAALYGQDVLGAGARQDHLRHRRVRRPQPRAAPSGPRQRPADDHLLRCGRQPRLRRRGRHLHRGGRRPVAARRAADHRPRRGHRGAGRRGPGYRRGLLRAGLQRPGRSALGHARPRRHRRPDARHGSPAPYPRHAREPRLPDARRHRRHARERRGADRAAGGRGRGRQRLPHAVPGRHPGACRWTGPRSWRPPPRAPRCWPASASASGRIPSSFRHLRRRERLFEPRMPVDERDSLYGGWRQAVARVRSGAASSEAARAD